MPLRELREIFHNLTGDRNTITSEIDPNYNCTAWATKDKSRWWEPFGLIVPVSFPPYYWPEDIPHNSLPETYIKLFEEQGFELTNNSELEVGFEKLALYIRDDEFQHVARQKQCGMWTSKVGPQEDIQHTLHDLEANHEAGYGESTIFMKKQI